MQIRTSHANYERCVASSCSAGACPQHRVVLCMSLSAHRFDRLAAQAGHVVELSGLVFKRDRCQASQDRLPRCLPRRLPRRVVPFLHPYPRASSTNAKTSIVGFKPKIHNKGSIQEHWQSLDPIAENVNPIFHLPSRREPSRLVHR